MNEKGMKGNRKEGRKEGRKEIETGEGERKRKENRS